jgi:hypothetical protein
MSFKTNLDVLKHIRKVLGENVEIRDATFPLRLQPITSDAEGAEPKNPFNCLFVHCAKRMYGALITIFWKHVAYVDMVDSDGVRRVYRFRISREAIERTKAFDKGEPYPPGAAITLIPPLKSDTLKAHAKRTSRHHAKKKQARIQVKNAEQRAKEITEQLKRIMANEKQDSKKIAEVKKRKATAEKAVLRAKVKMNKKRKSPAFDLTTRNGAFGNYHFAP